MKTKITLPPVETKIVNSSYKVYPESCICIPRGTKLEIYLNIDPNDPNSDVEPWEVVTTSDHTIAILLDTLSVIKLNP